MTKQTVLVAVDASDASVVAAKIGWELADAVGDECQLVHVTTNVSRMPATLPPLDPMYDLMERVQVAARRKVQNVLRGRVPEQLVDGLQIRMGRAAWLLPFIVDEFDAALLVLGRKRHAGPVRWFGGSTIHHVVRTVDVPMLIADAVTTGFNRLLVAVDGSHGAPLVLKGAIHLAKRCGAELRVINVIEPIPYLGEFPATLTDAGYTEWASRRFDEFMDTPSWRDLDQVVRQGPVTSTIVEEAERWSADLVVAGSHGAGWLDRVLVGSTTQRLLNRLPGSLYVVPVGAPAEVSEKPTAAGAETPGR